MESEKHKAYRNQFEKLTKRTLFSYPFFAKSDQELISDAINRSKSDFEFALFKLGQREVKTVIAGGKAVDTRYFPLLSLLNEADVKPVQIKISTFHYPSYFISSLKDRDEAIKSTFNYETYPDYSSLYHSIEKYYGEIILITTCWDTVTTFAQLTKCVNILPTPKDDLSLANLIRQSFVKERTAFIYDILQKPQKYISFYPVENEILTTVFEEFKLKFEDELHFLSFYETPTNSEDYDDPLAVSDYELSRDNFYALTDGQEGDYPSRDDYNSDDYEIGRMMGF